MARIKPLTIDDAQYIARQIALELMNSIKEPIPPFETRSPGKLESCLAEPFQTFDGKYLHRTFEQRAAVLFYLVTKNHCFENGNKRMAVVLTMLFFYTNDRWLDIDTDELYNIACLVADSHPKDRNAIQKILIKTFRRFQSK